MSERDVFPADPDDERPVDGYGGWFDGLAAAVDEETLFATLAEQRPPRSKLARERLRGRLVQVLADRTQALRLGIRPAQVADAWLFARGETGVSAGSEFVVDEPVPFEEPVDPTKLFDDVFACFDSYLWASNEALIALTVWSAFTHVFDLFSVSPLLLIGSPTMRCGKTTASIVVRRTSRRGVFASNITPAFLYQAIERLHPTLCIDEGDTFLRLSKDLRGVLNAGHTRDTAVVGRGGGDGELRAFSTWAPKCLAAIGGMPPTIEDRSIRVPLTRKPDGIEKRSAFDVEQVAADCDPLCRKLARFALDNLDAIASAVVERPAGLHDREFANWRPLLAIASIPGPEWLERTSRAAKSLAEATRGIDEVDFAQATLAAVWDIVVGDGPTATRDVIGRLIRRDDGPWAEWWERQVKRNELRSPATRLARILRPFRVAPKELWIGRKERGYSVDCFPIATLEAYLRDGRTVGGGGSPEASGGASPTDSYRPTDPPGRRSEQSEERS